MSAVLPGVIPCPSCAAPLPLPVEAVLVGAPITCRSCGTALHVDQAASQPGLNALARWHAGTAAARQQAAASDGNRADRRRSAARARRDGD